MMSGTELKGNFRDDRYMARLIELAAKFIAEEAGRTTLITPLRADVSRDHKNATIYVSVFPESEREHALKYLDRNRKHFRGYLKKHGRFAHLPFVKFAFDYGEQNRQHLDDLSKEI